MAFSRPFGPIFSFVVRVPSLLPVLWYQKGGQRCAAVHAPGARRTAQHRAESYGWLCSAIRGHSGAVRPRSRSRSLQLAGLLLRLLSSCIGSKLPADSTALGETIVDLDMSRNPAHSGAPSSDDDGFPQRPHRAHTGKSDRGRIGQAKVSRICEPVMRTAANTFSLSFRTARTDGTTSTELTGARIPTIPIHWNN